MSKDKLSVTFPVGPLDSPNRDLYMTALHGVLTPMLRMIVHNSVGDAFTISNNLYDAIIQKGEWLKPTQIAWVVREYRKVKGL